MTAQGNQIGMAPGAKWIGCRNMDQGDGTPARYIECMQWFLAPTRIGGGDPDPTKAPHITNNSWECPASEGCSFDTLQAAVEAQAAAGIMMVSAAQKCRAACQFYRVKPPRNLRRYLLRRGFEHGNRYNCWIQQPWSGDS